MKKSVVCGLGLLVTAVSAWSQYLITTVAGGGLPPTASPALSAPLPEPLGVAADGLGNLYFSAANCVFKVDAAGVLTRVAGSNVAGYSGDGGPAVSALLDAPQGLALDGVGNLYIADSGNSRIRKVAPDGTITTAAGNGTPGYSGNGGPATSAQLRFPHGVALGSSGNLYIADTYNNRIRKVTASGTISTVAGTAFVGWFGDGGAATEASLDLPYGVAVDGAGNFYIADTNDQAIRKVTVANGIITTVAGSGTAGYTGDGASATAATLDYPDGVVVDAAGNLFIADTSNNVIREVAATSGNIATVVGNATYGYAGDGGAATSAELRFPSGLALDAAGNLYIADTNNNVIRKVAAGVIATLAGNANGASGDGGPATSALLSYAEGAALDTAGNLYIADSGNNRIRKVAANGTITTVAGTGAAGYGGDAGPATAATLNQPAGVALDGAGNLYIADTYNHAIRKVAAATGVITTVAGNGTQGYSGNAGAATSAQLAYPYGIALDTAGNLYIADTWNAVIRKVTTAGIISTVAGSNVIAYSGDGGPATQAGLNYPYGVAVDSSGALYIADTANSVIRKVATVNITTMAGTPTAGYAGDGGAATAAELQFPHSVAVDASGNVFIADSGNIVVREVSGGNISTVAGNRGYGFAGDGGLSTSAQLDSPYGVALDSTGDVYITDQSVVRLMVPQAASHALLNVTEQLPASFSAGESGAFYLVVVSNNPTAAPTSGTVTLTENLFQGLSLVSMSGTGWSCTGNTCTRSDALSPGASYPTLIVTVNVSADAPSQVTNQVSVSGGTSPATGANSATPVIGGSLAAPALVSPANGAMGVLLAPGLTWSAASGATSYEVYFGTQSTPPMVTTTTGTSYATGTLSVDTTYYWQIVARNGSGSASSATWSFTTGAAVAALRFVPVTPCRVADTRSPAGPFGGPTLAAGAARSFAVPQSACSIPATAQAYSLNVTVVPKGTLSYLTLWPTGLAQPLVSTLNAFAGNVVANAAIVPAGTGGAVSVFVSNQTDVVLDINGYFDSTGAVSSFSFYPATPCRVADTRNPTGQFGGPSMFADQTRDFPIPLGPCGIPAGPTAYSLNVTVVPDTDYLGYLSTWPTGSPQPLVSTLNSWTGKIVANAALVPAGTNGSVSVFVTDPTDVVLDVNGYFGQPGGAGALSFYPVAPCRVADTRNPTGPFGGPEMAAGSTRSFAVPASGCSVPSAAAYSLNVTVVPDGTLSYLSAWPTGSAQPFVSTLNSLDGSVVANAAIVPAGTNGAISVFVTNNTHVILDINGYFAP
jgi:sugar lactone lactonase YvrE